MPGSRRNGVWWLFGGAVTAVVLPVLFFATGWHSPAASAPATVDEAAAPETAFRVETIQPANGGLALRTSQPGSAHSYESVDLYAKVSGYLGAQHVDIGSHVRRGELLAEVDVPELVKDVESTTALWQQAQAEGTLAEARLESAIADQKAAEARILQAEADVERCTSEVDFCQKQHARIIELNGLKAIEDRVVDEKLRQVQAACAGERAAQSAVVAARQLALAAASRVGVARADVQVSQARVRVALAAVERAKVMASYRQITSPYDGVVTCRNFHRGAFVRSPDQGGEVPLLSVDRTDLMRIVVRIPEREVPFVHPGDKTMICFDALPNREFAGVVSRIAHSEEAQTRTMLAEIDLPNPEGLVRDHMYGRVEIELEEAPAGVTVPSASLVGNVADGNARLFVAEDGRARTRQVRIGRDTGIEVEIFSGVSEGETVIVRPPGGLSDGARVTCTPAPVPPQPAR